MKTKKENRANWSISQAVDDVILSLRAGSINEVEARRRMDARLVPFAVQKRVINGQAVLRHRRFPGEHAPYKSLASV